MQDFRTKLKKKNFWHEYIICRVAKFQKYELLQEYLFRVKTKSNHPLTVNYSPHISSNQKQMKGKAKILFILKDAKSRSAFFFNMSNKNGALEKRFIK